MSNISFISENKIFEIKDNLWRFNECDVELFEILMLKDVFDVEDIQLINNLYQI